MEENISCITTMNGAVSGEDLLDILTTKFKFKLKFVSSNITGRICWRFWLQNLNLNLNLYFPLCISKGKCSYLGNIYKILGVENAHTPFQALILKNKLYVNKTIHEKINSLGKEKQQHLQVFVLESWLCFIKAQSNLTNTCGHEKIKYSF